MIRGIERRAIFHSDGDRTDFLERLDRLVPELGFRCFGFALMSNHVHLVLRSESVGVSRLMARLNGGYARAFNLRHERSGYLFQNRFKSRRIESDAELLGVVTYVCRNPLDAGMLGSVKELERWPWTSYSALVGERPAWSFESTSETLELIADAPATAREALAARVKRERAGADTPSVWTPLAGAESVGGSVSTVQALDEVIRLASESQGVDPETLIRGSRGHAVSRARAMVAHIAVAEIGMTGRSVAAALGISPGAVTRAAERGRDLVAEAGSPRALGSAERPKSKQ